MNIFHILYNYVITIIFSKVGRNSKKKKNIDSIKLIFKCYTHTVTGESTKAWDVEVW